MGTRRESRETQALTPREGQLLQLLVESCNVTELARRVGLAPTTVRQHLRRTKNKLNQMRLEIPEVITCAEGTHNLANVRNGPWSGFPNLSQVQPVSVVAIKLIESGNGDPDHQFLTSSAILMERLRLYTRTQDWVGGGANNDTFLIVLPYTSLGAAEKIVTRLRQAIGLALGMGVQQWNSGRDVNEFITQVINIADADALRVATRRSLYGVQNL